MLLECCPCTYRPFGLSGRSTPRLGGVTSSIPFFFLVPALASGLTVSQILRPLSPSRYAEPGAVKGDPSWV
jgi:hypothetical protein